MLVFPNFALPNFSLPRIPRPHLPRILTPSPQTQVLLRRIYDTATRVLIAVAKFALKVAYYLTMTLTTVLFFWKFSWIAGMGLFTGLFIPQADQIIQRVNQLWEASYKIHIFAFLSYSFVNFPVAIPWVVFLYSTALGNWVAHRIIDNRIVAG